MPRIDIGEQGIADQCAAHRDSGGDTASMTARRVKGCVDIVVVDNAMPDPLAYRAFALSQPFETLVAGDEDWHGIANLTNASDDPLARVIAARGADQDLRGGEGAAVEEAMTVGDMLTLRLVCWRARVALWLLFVGGVLDVLRLLR